MAPPKDPYKTLGVDKKASADEIRKAYRKLARQYHPDKNPGDAQAEERFKDIQQANDILSDPEKRKQYDQGGGIFGGGFDPGAFRTGGGGPGFGGIGDILSDLFGGGAPGGARRPGPERGRDLETEVHISFEQAMEGAQVPVNVQVPAACPTCHGTGAKPGTTPQGGPRCPAPSASGCPRAPSTARSSGCAARAPQSSAARAAETSTTGSRSTCRARSTASRRRPWTIWPR